MKKDEVFSKFHVPRLTVSKRKVVTIEQLEEGMNQMNYPMLKGIVAQFEGGKTFDGRKM